MLAYFVACGVSRLARYNVTAETLSGDDGKVKYFEGTPIPTSIVLVGLLALAAAQGAVGPDLWGGKVVLAGFTLHPLVLLFAASGSLMISRIRIPKLLIAIKCIAAGALYTSARGCFSYGLGLQAAVVGLRFTSTMPTATRPSAATRPAVMGSPSQPAPNSSANTGVRNTNEDILVAG